LPIPVTLPLQDWRQRLRTIGIILCDVRAARLLIMVGIEHEYYETDDNDTG
jgi:hypothetical protein